MKSILRNTAILSGSSLISIVLSLVTAKVLALHLNPSGYGYYGLLQSFISVASLVAGLGMATGLVRLGAGAAVKNDERKLCALRSAAWVIFAIVGSAGMLLLAVFRVQVSKWALGDPDHGRTMIWLGVGVLFTAAAALQTGVLNSYHRVGALARSSVANTVMSAAITILAVLLWGTQGVVAAAVGGGIAGWLASRYYVQREIRLRKLQPSYSDVAGAIKSLARFGTPYTASMLIGTGVQLALPMVVVHQLNTASVGYYRASAAIAVGYLGFLMTAMGQDYYPRLSAAGKDNRTIIKLINDQHRLVMMVAVPTILATLALVPYMIPIVYSRKFLPAVDILEWQLIGDIFRFSSLTMSFAVLAHCESFIYFLTELSGGVLTLSTTWLGIRWFGMQGLGMAFLATYAAYYCIVWAVLRRRVPLAWTSSNKRMMLSAIATGLMIRILPATPFAAYRTPIALGVAIAAGSASLVILRRELFAKHGSESPAPTVIIAVPSPIAIGE